MHSQWSPQLICRCLAEERLEQSASAAPGPVPLCFKVGTRGLLRCPRHQASALLSGLVHGRLSEVEGAQSLGGCLRQEGRGPEGVPDGAGIPRALLPAPQTLGPWEGLAWALSCSKLFGASNCTPPS